MKNIILIVSWGTWIARNMVIFRDSMIRVALPASEWVSIYETIPIPKENQSARVIREEEIRGDIPLAYFDGASDFMNRCGAGLTIHFPSWKTLKASMGLGPGTNNFAELQSLKLLLCWLTQLGLRATQIFGDSMNIIKWFNGEQRYQNYILLPLLE